MSLNKDILQEYKMYLSTVAISFIQANNQGWSVRSVGGAGLVVPLTPDTYPLCWGRAFLGVRADPSEQVDSVTVTNNVGMHEIILDCGGKTRYSVLIVLVCRPQRSDIPEANKKTNALDRPEATVYTKNVSPLQFSDVPYLRLIWETM